MDMRPLIMYIRQRMRWMKLAAIALLVAPGTLFAQGGSGTTADSAAAGTAATGPIVPGPAVQWGGAKSAVEPTILADDPAPLLGCTVADAITRFGAPDSVYAVRGPESWQDDVAFAYASGFTFFLYGDRLWQVRLTPPYGGSIYGIFLGDASGKVLSSLGQPYERQGDALVYRMPYKGYPVELKLVFDKDSLVDVYLYRADF